MIEFLGLYALWMHFCAQLRPPIVERLPRAIIRTRSRLDLRFGRLSRTPLGYHRRVLEWDPGLTLLSHDVRPYFLRTPR